MKSLEGRVALVAGATLGAGRGIAIELVAERPKTSVNRLTVSTGETVKTVSKSRSGDGHRAEATVLMRRCVIARQLFVQTRV